MNEHTTADEYRFPDLDLVDVEHLQRMENLHGRDRVLGWLRAKVAVPLRHQFEDDFDDDAYYEAMRERYVNTNTAEGGESP